MADQGRTPSREWALLGQHRPFEFEMTVALYGCQECGLAVWDRERHERVCPTAPARTTSARDDYPASDEGDR